MNEPALMRVVKGVGDLFNQDGHVIDIEWGFCADDFGEWLAAEEFCDEVRGAGIFTTIERGDDSAMVERSSYLAALQKFCKERCVAQNLLSRHGDSDSPVKDIVESQPRFGRV